MKLGCCSWSYHRALEAKRIDFTGWLRIVSQELGVGGVDIIAEHLPDRTTRGLRDVKKRCTDYRLTVSSLSPGNNFGRPSAAARRAEVARVTRWIDAACVLGAPCVRIFAGWPPAGRQAELWPAMVACVRQAAKTAEGAGVTLVVEPHNHGGFLADSRTTLRLIREIGSPWVRINLDTGNYADADPYAGINASLPWAPHVVAKVHDLDADGEAVGFDYAKIFSLLKRHGYHGFLTLEYEGKTDERRSVPRAIAMLRRYAMRYEMIG